MNVIETPGRMQIKELLKQLREHGPGGSGAMKESARDSTRKWPTSCLPLSAACKRWWPITTA
jgi:hypothetical protein